MNATEIINWSRKPPTHIWLFRVTRRSRAGKGPRQTFTRLRYPPTGNPEDYIVSEMYNFIKEMGFNADTGVNQETFDEMMNATNVRKQELYDMYKDGLEGELYATTKSLITPISGRDSNRPRFKAVLTKIKSFE